MNSVLHARRLHVIWEYAHRQLPGHLKARCKTHDNGSNFSTQRQQQRPSRGPYAYTLGAIGNKTRIDESNGLSRKYEYDDLYRLKKEQVIDPANVQTYQNDFAYDAVGNRLNKSYTSYNQPAAPNDYIYNNADQLLTESEITYTYDLNGNLASKTDGNGTTTYEYDYDNRLAKVTSPSGTTAYQYDSDGNRVRAEASNGVIRYLVDANRGLSQVLAEYGSTGALAAYYVYADDLISMIRNTNASYYHFDGLGSTRLLSDSIGIVTDAYQYDAFGKQLARTGATDNEFLFTGQQYNSNIGFYYLRARYYQPTVGRFTGHDPYEGDSYVPMTLHKYSYASNDPVNKKDLTGRFTSLGSVIVTISLAGILLGIAQPAFSGTIQGGLIIYVDQPGAGGSPAAWAGSPFDPDVGHTFWTLYNKTTNEGFTEGFYPSQPVSLTHPQVPGILRNDTGHDYEVMKEFKLIGSQYKAAKAYRDQLKSSPPLYNLNDFNCTDAAEAIARRAGHPIPDTYCEWPGGGGSCPGALGQLLK